MNQLITTANALGIIGQRTPENIKTLVDKSTVPQNEKIAWVLKNAPKEFEEALNKLIIESILNSKEKKITSNDSWADKCEKIEKPAWKEKGQKNTSYHTNFVDVVNILEIADKVEYYTSTGRNPPSNPEEGKILEGMEDLGNGYQRPKLKKRNKALEYPFRFRITKVGYEFQEDVEGEWRDITFKQAQARHVEYWNTSTNIMWENRF